jgi:hypothetical protein
MLKKIIIGCIVIVFSAVIALQTTTYYPGIFSGVFGLSTDEIGDRVISTMQSKFDTKYGGGMTVNSIKVVHKKDNEYEGLVNITSEGDDHNILVDITADKKNVIWKMKPGWMKVLFQKRIQQENDRNNLMNYLMNNTGFRR